jgi:hypothetical protein
MLRGAQVNFDASVASPLQGAIRFMRIGQGWCAHARILTSIKHASARLPNLRIARNNEVMP